MLKFYLLIAAVAVSAFSNAQQPANNTLSNLSATTSVNSSVLPHANNLLNLGSTSLKWKNVYLYNLVFPNGSIQTTAYTPNRAGTGISIRENTISNTAPDKIVSISAGNGISVTGTYPNFNISGTSSSQWITNGTAVYYNTGNVGIGIDNPVAKLQVDGGDALINGITVGMGSGSVNTNVAYGPQALFSNTTGYDNSAIGDHALYSNVDGLENTAMGNGTLYYNVSGYGNMAVGNGALLNNGAVPNPFSGPEGSYNAAGGFFALFNNSIGSHNTGFGTSTLNTNTIGSYNTAIGGYSDVAKEDLVNATAIGANSIVNDNNKIRLGDVNVTVVESAAGSWTTSDGRFKKNIKEEVVGLPFIKLLRPVVYNFDAVRFDAFLSQRFPDSVKTKRKEALRRSNSKTGSIVQSGLIAQEVAAAAKKTGYDFNGVHVPQNDEDNYSISYEKLVVPLIKAVQELSAQNEEMKKQLNQLQLKLIAVQKKDQQNGTFSTALLQQNAPNPFSNSTSIGYNLPINTRTAELIITDQQGNRLQRFSLNGAGKGTVNINSSKFNAGVYQYTLYADGKIAESKQMTVIK